MSLISDTSSEQSFILNDDESTTITTENEEHPDDSRHSSPITVERLTEYEDGEWIDAIATPSIIQKFVIKHPKVFLQFLRFIDEYNEQAEDDDYYMLRAIPGWVIRKIQQHSFVQNPTEETREDVEELLELLERHRDLSEGGNHP